MNNQERYTFITAGTELVDYYLYDGAYPSEFWKKPEGSILLFDNKNDRICLADVIGLDDGLAEPDDTPYADHCYLVSVAACTSWDAVVFANNESEAMDIVADWAEDHAPGWLLDDSDRAELEAEGFICDYSGPHGNHGVYFSELGGVHTEELF